MAAAWSIESALDAAGLEAGAAPRRHVHEAELKEQRRSTHKKGHESRPPARYDDPS